MSAKDYIDRTHVFAEKAREMVRHGRELGEACAYSVYADRLKDAADLVDLLRGKLAGEAKASEAEREA